MPFMVLFEIMIEMIYNFSTLFLILYSSKEWSVYWFKMIYRKIYYEA